MSDTAIIGEVIEASEDVIVLRQSRGETRRDEIGLMTCSVNKVGNLRLHARAPIRFFILHKSWLKHIRWADLPIIIGVSPHAV